MTDGDGAAGAYGGVVLEHFRRPRNQGRLPAPDRWAEGANAICGDRVRIELALAGAVVREAWFSGNACAVCTAAASLLTEWLRGRTVDDARALDDATVLGWLGGRVPAARLRCALLPRETLRRALERDDGATSPVGERIVGVLLAAGRARRFGGQKLVAPLGGVPLVRRAAASLLSVLPDVVVVVAADDAAVRDALAGLDVTFAVNREADEGMASSIRAAVATVRDRADAIAVALGDQPGLAPEAVAALRDAFTARSREACIVAPRYAGGMRGHPVLFGAVVFDELAALRGDVGARAVLEREPARVRCVTMELAAPADVDTPADLQALDTPRC